MSKIGTANIHFLVPTLFNFFSFGAIHTNFLFNSTLVRADNKSEYGTIYDQTEAEISFSSINETRDLPIKLLYLVA